MVFVGKTDRREKECKNRLYHDTCVENPEEAVGKGRHWRCKECS